MCSITSSKSINFKSFGFPFPLNLRLFTFILVSFVYFQMKTPVSLLQEYLVEQGTVPRYIARELSTGPSTPKVFQYELSIFGGQYQSTGSGQSKKQAKHEAANNMLLKLSEQRPDLKKLLERNDFYEKMDKVTSNNSSIKNNSIFQLDSKFLFILYI